MPNARAIEPKDFCESEHKLAKWHLAVFPIQMIGHDQPGPLGLFMANCKR